jgi:hypothetical protein
MKVVRTTFFLPIEQHQRLQLLAVQHGLSIAWQIRQAGNDFVNPERIFEPINTRPSKIED